MSKLYEIPGLRTLLPFVRASYGSPSRYIWEEDQGQKHLIQQYEGGEQSDPLMPLLFSLAIQIMLWEVKAQMVEGECLFAFLDNVYVVAQPARIRVLYNLLGAKIDGGGRDPIARKQNSHVESPRIVP